MIRLGSALIHAARRRAACHKGLYSANPPSMTELSPAAPAIIELPHVGRTADTENFPVGSWLLAAEHRPSLLTYYAFARAADDIADHPRLHAPDNPRPPDPLHAIPLGPPPADPPDRAQEAA